jgi:hypothetical protein
VPEEGWKSAEAKPPLLPGWGEVQTWCGVRLEALRPPAPPALGSTEQAEALAEVRRLSDARTPEQQRIDEFWADGPGTATPPGHWNELAAAEIARAGLEEPQAAELLAELNMAQMDAGIAAWECKYHFWYPRPSQLDPAITLPVGLPNFPAYVSGHASFSGAAAEILGAYFPDQAARFDRLAEEASMSRVYGGIHFRFDGDEGLALGRRIAREVLRMRAQS